VNRLQETYTGQVYNQRRSTVAQEGQRHPCHRHDSHGHSHIDKRVEDEHAHQPDSHGAASWVASTIECNKKCAHADNRVSDNDEHGNLESKLLSDDCENKVGMSFRNKRALTLVSFSKTSALNSAASDCDQTLKNVIARASCIRPRIDETGQTFLLIWFQMSPQLRTDYSETEVGCDYSEDKSNTNQEVPVFSAPEKYQKDE